MPFPRDAGKAYHERGVEAFGRGQLAEARDALEHAVMADPQCARYRASLGKVMLAQGDVDGAVAALERAVSNAPGEVSTAVWLATAYVLAEREDAAAALVKEVGSDAFGRGSVSARVARCLLELEATAESVPWLRRALQGERDDVALLHNLGWALACSGDIAGAEAPLRRAIDVAGDNAEVAGLLAYVLREQGRAAEALEVVANARAKGADSAFLADEAGSAHQALGQYDAALREHELACRLEPDEPACHIGRAFVLARSGLVRQGKDAAARAEALLEEAPPHPPAKAAQLWSDLSSAQCDFFGDLAAAERAALRAIELAPASIAGHQALAGVYALRADLDGARAALQQARQQSKGYVPEAFERLEAWVEVTAGDALLGKGQLRSAIGALRRALERHGDRADAVWSLSFALLSVGALAEAERLLRRGLAVRANDPQMWSLLADVKLAQDQAPAALHVVAEARGLGVESSGLATAAARVHIALGDYKASLDEHAKAGAHESEDPRAHIGLALTLAAMGNTREASEAAQRAEELAGASPDAYDALDHATRGENLAWLRLELRDPRGAEREALRAVGAAPEVPSAHYVLARAREAYGDAEGAISAVRAAVAAYGTPQAMEPLAELAESLGFPEDAGRVRDRGQEVAAELASILPPG